MLNRISVFFILLILTACSDPLEQEAGQDNLYGYWHIIGYRDNGGERLEDTEIAYAFFEPDVAERAFQQSRETFTLYWKDEEHFELIPCIPADQPCAPVGLNNFDINAQTTTNIEVRHWILDENGTKIYDETYIMERINQTEYLQF